MHVTKMNSKNEIKECIQYLTYWLSTIMHTHTHTHLHTYGHVINFYSLIISDNLGIVQFTLVWKSHLSEWSKLYLTSIQVRSRPKAKSIQRCKHTQIVSYTHSHLKAAQPNHKPVSTSKQVYKSSSVLVPCSTAQWTVVVEGSRTHVPPCTRTT